MGNEENRFEKRQDKKNINKKSLVKRIILGALAFILIFFISIFGYFSGFFEIFWCEVSMLHTDFCTCLHFPCLLAYFRNIISIFSYFYNIPWKVRIFHQIFCCKIQSEYFSTNFWISAVLFLKGFDIHGRGTEFKNHINLYQILKPRSPYKKLNHWKHTCKHNKV